MSWVPCPCDFLGIRDPIECAALNELARDPPRLGQLYAGIYSAASHVNEIITDVPEIVQRDLVAWFIRLTLYLILPWLIMFIALFIVLAQTGVITHGTAIVLIVMVIFLTAIALIFLHSDTLGVIRNISTEVGRKISTNWENKKNSIVSGVRQAYVACDYFPSQTPGCDTTCGGICPVCRVLDVNARSLKEESDSENELVRNYRCRG